MRQGSNGRRPRRNNQGRRNVPLRAQTFDSNGPEGRIRGTAHQVYEKYLALARDASAQSDRIRAENLLQHAEHYSRIINESMDPEDEAERDSREADAADEREARDDAERSAGERGQGERGQGERGQGERGGGRNGPRGRNRRRYGNRGGDGRAAGNGADGGSEAGGDDDRRDDDRRDDDRRDEGGDGGDGVEVVGQPGDGQN